MIRVLPVGLPGNMASVFSRHADQAPDISLLPNGITGPDTDQQRIRIGAAEIHLVRADDSAAKDRIVRDDGPFIAVDFTEPRAAEANIEWYCSKGIDFVMGTTGVSMSRLAEEVRDARICAVAAPNMAKQIVALQAMMEFGSQAFPGCFAGYSLRIVESHQQGKLDTSGTARAMVAYFNALGVDFDVDSIVKIRHRDDQLEMGVPESALGGHGWHEYSLESPDGTVHVRLVHNVNGRDVYADGTLDAVRYLHAKLEAGVKGKVFTMIHVLGNG